MPPGTLGRDKIEGEVNVHSLSFPIHAKTLIPDNSTAVVITSSPAGSGHRLKIHCYACTRHVQKVKFPIIQAQERNFKNDFRTTLRFFSTKRMRGYSL